MEQGMDGTRERTFEHQGGRLTVRAGASPEGWKVRVFDGERPVTGIVYEFRNEVRVDALTQEVLLDLVEHLM
jgi:hypothetical protein